MNSESKSCPNLWPWALIAYFIFFISLTAGGVVYLSGQKMDLVRGDYYDDEIRYQKQLDRMNRTRPFVAEVMVVYDSAKELIKVGLPKSQIQSSGRIRLYRPSDESLDQDIKLTVGPDGTQSVSAKTLEAGLWKVRVYWTAAGQDYFYSQTVVINPTGS